jgi:hypothetical protein
MYSYGGYHLKPTFQVGKTRKPLKESDLNKKALKTQENACRWKSRTLFEPESTIQGRP